MLLKVSDGNGGWVLIDNVDQAHLLPKNYSVINQTELVTLEGIDALNLISKECFIVKDHVLVGVIEFIRNGATRRILFTNVVYVCNDRGDTLDRLTVELNRPKKGGK